MTEVYEVACPEDAALDVVFLHGLDGDARMSWTAGAPELFWPQWLGEDVPRAAIWTVGYDAWSSGWRGQSMSLPDRAINLLALLQTHMIGERPLYFVAHSMGGLLAKEMLLHASERRDDFAVFADAIQGVAYLATPHTGSGVVKVVDRLGRLYRGTAAVEDLRRNAPHLRQLNDRYRDWVADAGIRHLVFFETRDTAGVRVVDETSANPGIAGVRPIGVDADHTAICKLVSRRELVYGQVRRFVAGANRRPRSDKSGVHVDGPNHGTIVVGDGNTIGAA